MQGLNRTAPLKFNHPGLGTTVTRAGERLVIQNDIGVTEAHVLVIAVTSATVTITYTDVHMPRLAFFQSLFDDWDVEWSDTLSRRTTGKQDGGIYHLSVGTFAVPDREECCAFLAHLGSRLVFLIDWNKARKQLRNFLLNKDAVAVIQQAARQDIGHRGFLELGGDRLIYAALDLAARVPLRYGEPLHQILGREKTMEYLSWVLRAAAQGLLRGESRLLIQDRCRAELLRYFRTAQVELLERSTAHATLMIDVALALQTSVIALRSGSGTDRVPRNATRAKRWEREADLIVSEVRTLSRRIEEIGFFSSLITAQDDALDYLEEGCFYATLLPDAARYPESLSGLEEMAGLSIAAAREFIRALSAAQFTRAGSSREEMQEFFSAANRVIAIEQECDDAYRRTERCLIREVRPGRRALRLHPALARDRGVDQRPDEGRLRPPRQHPRGAQAMTGTIAVFGTNRDTGAVSRESYGNKASVLAEMAEIGIPVPPGFALPVEVCEEYLRRGPAASGVGARTSSRSGSRSSRTRPASGSGRPAARSWSRSAPGPRSRCRGSCRRS